MPLRVTSQGEWKRTEAWLQKLKRDEIFTILDKYGKAGVTALASATPVDSGLTAQSWSYEVVQRSGYHSVRWLNSNAPNGRPVAILLQYGHATGTGGYVQGYDYIMPAIRPIFDQIDVDIRKAVTS